MLSRKSFLHKGVLATAGFTLFDFMLPSEAAAMQEQISSIAALTAAQAAMSEGFWDQVRAQYIISADIINMNNGGVNPQPKMVRSAYIRNYEFCNDAPSYSMWRVLDKEREPLRERVAKMMGVTKEEIAFNRNTTEGLNTIIFGMDLKPGDEIVLSNFDYPNMENAWKQRAKRDGIKLNYVELEMPVEDDEAVVKKFAEAITPRTKLVHITHMMNWTGQIMPVRKIADMAHVNGCEVLVDGSHSFAHVVYKIPDLGADYYAASCHKWLGAPFGTGFMYIAKNKIQKIWPLVSAPMPEADNIGKFECLGTRSFAAEMAVRNAIDYHDLIGAERKEERLRYLKNYWCEQAAGTKGFKLYSSLKPQYGCAIATFGLAGKDADEIEAELAKAKIHTSKVKHGNVNGVRISPNVYTTIAELDLLVETIDKIAQL